MAPHDGWLRSLHLIAASDRWWLAALLAAPACAIQQQVCSCWGRVMTYAVLQGKHRYRVDKDLWHTLTQSKGVVLGVGLGVLMVVALGGFGSIAYEANGLYSATLVTMDSHNSSGRYP